MANKARVTGARAAGENHRVLSVEGGGGAYRKTVCEQCPWRKDQTGAFPAEAFRHSANTSHDMSQSLFACHMAGAENPMTCAGFLLRGAAHNLAVRFKCVSGEINPDSLIRTGPKLHDGYISMAVANGVPGDDPALLPCRLSPREERRKK